MADCKLINPSHGGLTCTNLDAHLGKRSNEQQTLKQRVSSAKEIVKNYNYKRFLSNRFPIIKLLYNYDIRRDLLRDFLSGVSGGMAMIPQAMGYATVLGVPVVYGLYSIVFSSLVYSVMSSSAHASCTASISGALFGRDAVASLNLPEVTKLTFKDLRIESQ